MKQIIKKQVLTTKKQALNIFSLTVLFAFISTSGFGQQYCGSNGNNDSDEYISRVQVGVTDKSSGQGSTSTGYSNFTSEQPTEMQAGAQITITVTNTRSSDSYAEGYAVWIDFNRNGTFEGFERVWAKAASATSSVTGTFTIPTNVTDGPTRMRVSMKYNAVPEPCESFQYGEVEDYTVELTTSSSGSVCGSRGLSTNNEHISRVQVGSLDNSSGVGTTITGYSNFTNIGTDLTKGQSTSIAVRSTRSSNSIAEFYAIWIDYNQDGDFTDSGEQVWMVDGTTASTATGSFTVSANAPLGITRMRVSMSANGVPAPCETFPRGEVEDYVVNIKNPDGGGDGYCSSNGNNTGSEHISRVKINSINNSSGVGTTSTGYSNFTSISTNIFKGTPPVNIEITATKASSSDNESFKIWIDYNQDGDFTDSGELVASGITAALNVNASFTVPDGALTGPTRMRVSMKYNSAQGPCESFQFGEVEDYTVNVRPAVGGDPYCSSNGNNTNREHISRVQIGSIDRSSGVGTTSTGYSDFTSSSTSLTKGQSNTITITNTRENTNDPQGYAVWIDYNRNNVFEGFERVWAIVPTTTSSVTGTFTLPSSASTGTTRMRVSMRYNGSPEPCGTFPYGEVEDYTVHITNNLVKSLNTGISAEEAKEEVDALDLELSVYPNPVKGTLYVKSRDLDLSSYRVVNMLGQEVAKGTSISDGVNVSNFETGMYIIQFNVGDETVSKRFVKE